MNSHALSIDSRATSFEVVSVAADVKSETVVLVEADGSIQSDQEVGIHFIQEEETIERTDVLSPLLGATATLKSDGSIEYTTDSIAAPVSEGGPVAALSSSILFSPVSPTAQT